MKTKPAKPTKQTFDKLYKSILKKLAYIKSTI